MLNSLSKQTAREAVQLRRVPERWFAIASLVVVAFFFSGPLWASSDLMRSLVNFFSLLALAQMWNLLAGYAGMLSIGQQAWIGLGGYTLFVVADDLQMPLILGFVVAALVSGLLALPASWLLFRLRGGYFAVGTWVIAEVFRLLVSNNVDWLRGGYGRTLNLSDLDRDTREIITYLLAVVIGLGATGLVFWLMRSRIGLALTAIRDSDVAAGSLGIHTTRMKLFVYVLCAAATGVVGSLIYLNLLRVTPDAAFSSQWTAFMIFIVVIGGIGTIEGPILGAIIFYFVRENLADFGEWSLIILGAVAIITMLVAPEGIWGIIKRRFTLEVFPVSRWLAVAGKSRQPKEVAEQVK
jgi:branched-chain amino acid transport system permease protein